MRTATLATATVTLAFLLMGCGQAGAPATSPSIPPSGSPTPSRSLPAGTPSPSVAPPVSPAAAASSASIDVHGLAFFDSLHGLLVGGSAWNNAVGVVWLTSDGGRSWSKSLSGTGPLDAVAVAGSGTAWAATACDRNARPDCTPGLFVSRDGGAGWTRLSAQPLTALSFPSATIGWAVGPDPDATGPNSGVLLSSTDGGRTWRRRPNACPMTTGTPVAVSFPDRVHGWVACNSTFGAGMATKAILATADGGTTWSVTASSPIPGQGEEIGVIAANGYLSGLAMAADGHGMLWMGRGVTERTADSGRTWIDMPPGEWDVREAAAGWAFDDREWLLYVWNGTDGGPAIEATHDGGRTWSIVAVLPAPAAG